MGWTSGLQLYRVILHLITTWILAIMLPQSAFGLVGAAAGIVGFLLLFKDLGTGPAIVQRRGLSYDTLSTLFWINVTLGLSGSIAIFLAAPLVARWMNDLALVPVLQALATLVFIGGLATTHQSLAQRQLKFALLAKTEASAMTIGAIAGISAALHDAGVWALVIQAVVTQALSTVFLLATFRWRPHARVCLRDLRGVAGFSLNLSGFNLINYSVRNLDQVIIFKLFGDAANGYYHLACKMLLFPLTTINASLTRVLFPLFAKIQEDDRRLQSAFLKINATIATLIFPFAVGFGVMAEPLIVALLPSKWEPVIPLTPWLAIVAMVHGVVTSAGNLYLAKGRTDWMLRWGMVSGTISIIAYLIGAQWGPIGVATAYAITTLVLLLPALYIPLRLIHLPLPRYLAILWRPLAASLLMGGAVWLLGRLTGPLSPVWDLAIRVPTGIAIYVALILWLDGNHCRDVFALVRSLGRREDAAA